MVRWTHTLCSLVLVLFAACGGCGDDADQTGDCLPGESRNPITGACEPGRVGDFADGGQDGGTTDGGGEMDMFRSPFLDMPADIPPEDLCNPDLDSDLDQLSNDCECRLGTDPARADTDNDGIHDGGEDVNMNCSYELGIDTDPRRADTDNDGLNDGDERDAGTDPHDNDSDDDNVDDGPEVHSGCMDPLNPDTDGDSLPDDLEDANGDGMLGTCVNRMYDPVCGGIESDPCSADTDGDGTPDNGEAQFLGCRPEDTANLVDPQFVEDVPGDYKLALDTGVTTGAVASLDAHAFNDAANNYAGFVASLPKPAAANSAEALSANVFGRVGAAYGGAIQRATGRRTQTHDGFAAVVSGVIELSGGLRADTVRDGVLASLAGVGTVSHSTSGSFSAAGGGDPMLVLYQVILRGGADYVVTAVAVPESDYVNPSGASGFRVDDLTGGTSVAQAGEALESECVSYRVDTRPKVDFIWILDGSGSMDDEMSQVRNFATTFTTILQNSNLDWRIGTVSSGCWEIANDVTISPSVKMLYDPPGLQGPCPGAIPQFPMQPPPYVNGRLCNNAFTTDPQVFRSCVDDVRESGPPSSTFPPVGAEPSEHTMTIGAAAIDRASPRSDSDVSKIRVDAAIVLIVVTDEFDQIVQGELGWEDNGGGGGGNDPTLAGGYNQAEVDAVVQPFVNYFLSAEVAATMFGIYWVPGTSCSSAAEAAAGIHTVVGATGGTAGSVCQNDLTATLEEIATASAGIASGLRLRGVPVAPSINTTVGEVQSGMIVDWTRSRADGWDYDAIVNRVTFQGPNPPQTGDRVVIAYRRWEGSIQQCNTDVDCPREQKYRCINGSCL